MTPDRDDGAGLPPWKCEFCDPGHVGATASRAGVTHVARP